VLETLTLQHCYRGDHGLDLGNCDSLTHLTIRDCQSDQYTAATEAAAVAAVLAATAVVAGAVAEAGAEAISAAVVAAISAAIAEAGAGGAVVAVGGAVAAAATAAATAAGAAAGAATTLTAIAIAAAALAAAVAAVPAPGSIGCTRMVWDIAHKSANLQYFGYEADDSIDFDDMEYQPQISIKQTDITALCRFCPNLTHLNIDSEHSDINDASVVSLATKATQVEHLFLHSGARNTDDSIFAIANLPSLTEVGILNLTLRNPRTLRALAHNCPQLELLHLTNCNVSEAELVRFVSQSVNLKQLNIGIWKQLTYRRKPTTVMPTAYDTTPLLSETEAEALHSAQVEWIGNHSIYGV
jgi:hypothetical protein